MKSEADRTWKILWHEKAVEELQLLDRVLAKQIIEKITTYLVQSPSSFGKSLSGNYKHLYRYRHGDYRIVYNLDHMNHHINVLAIGHRKNIYSINIGKRC